MNVNAIDTTAAAALSQPSAKTNAIDNAKNDQELRSAFDTMVGETFYSQMLKQMRKTVDKSSLFHGGRGEEVFEQQLDQLMARKMSDANASSLTGPMYDLFTLRRA
jgi:Rod binding domain-containing protein